MGERRHLWGHNQMRRPRIPMFHFAHPKLISRIVLSGSLLLAFSLPASSHVLEVYFENDPLKTIPDIGCSIKNISQRTTLENVRMVGFAFGRGGSFLGYAEHTMKGTIAPQEQFKFNLYLYVGDSTVHRIHFQFESNSKVLSHEVQGAYWDEKWPPLSPLEATRPSRSEAQTSARTPTRSKPSPSKCEFLVVGMAVDQANGKLQVNGRVRNVSQKKFYGPSIRITYYDSIGAYIGENQSKSLGTVHISGEAAYSYRFNFPERAKRYEIDFLEFNGIKIPHCIQ